MCQENHKHESNETVAINIASNVSNNNTSSERCPSTSLVIIALADALSALLLLASMPAAASLWSFSTGTLDLAALAMARLCCFPAFGYLAVWLGKPPQTPVVTTPGDEEEGSVLVERGDDGYVGVASDTNTTTTATAEQALRKAATSEKHEASLRKNAVLVVMFVFNTACQVYIGAKCISFSFPASSTAWPCVLMGSAVVFSNLEALLTKQLVTSSTKEAGVMFEGIHPHPLVWQEELAAKNCNKCRKREREMYECDRCSFFVCKACIQHHDNTTKEKTLRGDKGGAKQEEEVTHWMYFQRAAKLAWPQWRLFSVAFSCLFVGSIMANLMPHFQGKILDSIIKADPDSFSSLVRLYLALSVGVGLFEAVRSLCFNLAGRRMAMSIRNELFRAVMKQDTAFFDSATTGDLTSRLGGDVNATVSPVQRSMQLLLSSSLNLIFGLVMCFYTSWRLSMLAFTAIVPIIYLTETYAKWSSQINKQIRTDMGDANTVACQAIGNSRTIRAFSTERIEVDAYEEWTGKALSKAVKDAMAGAVTTAINRYLDLGAGVLVLWYGGSMAMAGQDGVSVGALITFQLYWARINNAFKGLNDLLNSFTQAAGAAQRVLSLIDHQPDICSEAGESLPAVGFTPKIELRQVQFAYQTRPGINVLDGLDLTINPGEVVALVGKSGCGKSTVIHMAMRFYDPIQGEILIDGKPLTKLHLESVHQQMALVAQDTQLFAKSIEENIAYGVGSYTQEALHEACMAANAHDFILSFPEGYATKVGERGVRLSGGQRQRIAIARAILRNPPILLLDEATSALDVESEAQVQQAIDRLCEKKDRTIVIVAHRLSTVVNADTIVVMDQGRAVEQGNHATLMKREGGMYRQLVEKQVAAASKAE